MKLYNFYSSLAWLHEPYLNFGQIEIYMHVWPRWIRFARSLKIAARCTCIWIYIMYYKCAQTPGVCTSTWNSYLRDWAAAAHCSRACLILASQLVYSVILNLFCIASTADTILCNSKVDHNRCNIYCGPGLTVHRMLPNIMHTYAQRSVLSILNMLKKTKHYL